MNNLRTPKKKADVLPLVGKQVRWERSHDRHRGQFFYSYGVVDRIEGKNVWFVSGEVRHFSELINIEQHTYKKEPK